jgi:hypothetical protein
VRSYEDDRGVQLLEAFLIMLNIGVSYIHEQEQKDLSQIRFKITDIDIAK